MKRILEVLESLENDLPSFWGTRDGIKELRGYLDLEKGAYKATNGSISLELKGLKPEIIIEGLESQLAKVRIHKSIISAKKLSLLAANELFCRYHNIENVNCWELEYLIVYKNTIPRAWFKVSDKEPNRIVRTDIPNIRPLRLRIFVKELNYR